MITNSTSDTEIFATVTQFYVRLRRVTGRVVDVMYMVENQEYAKHLIQYAKTIDDAELQRHIHSLNMLIFHGKNQTGSSQDESVINQSAPQSARPTERKQQTTWFLG